MNIKTDKKAKERIIEGALELFYYQGFHQTSVRQIAHKSNVNQALISYYFGSKKGLLEQLMIRFYEGYLHKLEETERAIRSIHFRVSYQERLLDMIGSGFEYLFDAYRMTRFIYRELTLDSTLIREVMTIYASKEKYHYWSLLEEAVRQKELADQDLEMLVLQLLNVLYMPFLQPQIIREVYHVEPHSNEFKSRYVLQLEKLVTHLFQDSTRDKEDSAAPDERGEGTKQDAAAPGEQNEGTKQGAVASGEQDEGTQDTAELDESGARNKHNREGTG
jgi:TetR/AcrR family transcriptional regulator, regulator of cefoperazone and chloramphenicol sensitivity